MYHTTTDARVSQSRKESESEEMGLDLIISLPDDVFYNTLLCIEHPIGVAAIVCKSIAPLCSETRAFVNNDSSSLWEHILGGFYLNSGGTSSVSAYRARTQRRSSKRLRQTTAKDDVIHAHYVLRDQTEMALQEVADMAISKSPKPLSLARLRGVLTNYGPSLNINQRSAIGGTFLVDCCRARCIKESVILACVKELVEKYNASAEVPATEGSSYQKVTKKKHNTLPALVVAAARGMPTVTRYLLQASPTSVFTLGTSRFRLFMNPKKSISATLTPLQFAEKMKEAELENGATERQLPLLRQCIRILREGEELRSRTTLAAGKRQA